MLCSYVLVTSIRTNTKTFVVVTKISLVFVRLGFPEATAEEKEVERDKVPATVSHAEAAEQPYDIGVNNCREKPIIVSRLC